MNFVGLMNPGLLALGVGLAAVPIVIHLLNRRRVQLLPWAAMQWLLAAMKRHQRRLKLENWLVLLLRVLAVALLGLALARPVLTDPELAGVFGGNRSVYVVIDTSYSMTARTAGGRAVTDVAKAEADAVLSGLGTKDAVAVIATNDPRVGLGDARAPFALVPRTVGAAGAAKAKEAVAGLHARDAPANWEETLGLVQRQTTENEVNSVVVVITDLQARDWKDTRTTQALAELLRFEAAVRVIDVGDAERRNLTVAEVKTATGRDAFVGRPLRLDVTIENQGAAPVANAKVSVFLDGNATPIRSRVVKRLGAADAETGQPGRENLFIDLPGRTFPEAGSHVLRVEVVPPHDDPGADSLGLDSRRGCALRVRDRIRVLAWTRSSRTEGLSAEAYLRGVYERWEIDDTGERVRERSPLYALTSVTSEVGLADALGAMAKEAPDLVVLANTAPRGRGIEAIRDFVAGGGALLVFVGDALTDPDALNDAFYGNPEHRLLPFAYDSQEVRSPSAEETPWAFDFSHDSGHRLAGPFTGDEAAGWIGLAPPAVWGRMTFSGDDSAPPPEDVPTTSPEGRVVLRFAPEGSQEEGRAAVVEGTYGLGRTLWVATSIDHGWLERTLFFLPVFLDEAAVYATSPDDARRNLEVGRRIVVTWLPRNTSGARFVVPGGAEVVPTRYEGLGETDRPVLIQDRVGTAGIWRLLYERESQRGERERVEERFAVNPDAREGHLRRARDADVIGAVPAESDLQILPSWDAAGKEAEEVRRGEISFLLLWIVIALLVLESILAWQFGRRSRR